MNLRFKNSQAVRRGIFMIVVRFWPWIYHFILTPYPLRKHDYWSTCRPRSFLEENTFLASEASFLNPFLISGLRGQFSQSIYNFWPQRPDLIVIYWASGYLRTDIEITVISVRPWLFAEIRPKKNYAFFS